MNRQQWIDWLNALQMAQAYIEYVAERDSQLHEEADGTPSISKAVQTAVDELNALLDLDRDQ